MSGALHGARGTVSTSEWRPLSFPPHAPHHCYHCRILTGVRWQRGTMSDGRVCTSGLGSSLRARSAKVQGVVAGHAVRAGVCLAFPSCSREARHTPHGARRSSPAPPQCPARAGLAASVLASHCQGSVVVEGPFPWRPPPQSRWGVSPPGCRGRWQGQIRPLSPPQR